MSKSEILDLLPKLEAGERREIFDRLCALQEAELSPVHQQWVDEALNSGPAQPATDKDWEQTLQRGLTRGTNMA